MDALDIARAQNMAENGRWFVAGVALINYLNGSPILAILMLFTLILAVLADIVRENVVSLVVYVYSALIVFF